MLSKEKMVWDISPNLTWKGDITRKLKKIFLHSATEILSFMMKTNKA